MAHATQSNAPTAANLHGVVQVVEKSICLERGKVTAVAIRLLSDVRKLGFAGPVRILQGSNLGGHVALTGTYRWPLPAGCGSICRMHMSYSPS
jgi:hypothetical protein